MNEKKLNHQDVMSLISLIEEGFRKRLNGESDGACQQATTLGLDATLSLKGAMNSLWGAFGDAPGVGASATAVAMGEIERIPRSGRIFSPTPTFIIGYRRSGTTLLAWLLDSHPNITCLPENPLCGSMFDTTTDRLSPLMQAGAVLRWILDEPRERFFCRCAQLISDTFTDYALRNEKKRWVCKELFLHHVIDLLDMAFDYQARFLYIIRHGVDAAFSASERFDITNAASIKSGLAVVNYLHEWCKTNDALMGFAERNRRRCFSVQYEDLVTKPIEVAKNIFSFLEEPWIPSILDDMQRSQHASLGDSKIHETGGRIHSDRRNRWVAWPVELIWELGRIANPTLNRLGYDQLPVRDVVQGGYRTVVDSYSS